MSPEAEAVRLLRELTVVPPHGRGADEARTQARAFLVAWDAGSRTRQCDPVGAVEIAARLGVQRRTVDQWRQRNIEFPAPRWTVGGRPAWNFDDVQAWAKARSATPEGGRSLHG